MTEAGFGADLGGEKFFDIKCRSAGLQPSCAVVVATVRALKMHGGVARGRAGPGECRGGEARHRQPAAPCREFAEIRVPVVVAINHFTADTEAEFEAIREAWRALGVRGDLCTPLGARAAQAPRTWRARWSAGSRQGTAALPAAVSAGA